MKGIEVIICFILEVVFICLVTTSMVYADVGGEDINKLKINIKDLEKQISGLQNQVKDLLNSVREKPLPPKDIESRIKDLREEVNVLKAKPQVRIPEVPKSEVTVPLWLKGTQFKGDLLVRWQSNFHNSSNYANNNNNRNRLRYRLRYYITKSLNEELLAGFRIATGRRDNNPNQNGAGFITNDGFLSGNRKGSNATAGSDDAGFGKLEAWIDQAYLEYTPKWLDGLTVWAGKFKENWKHKGFLIYKHYVGFDGLAESYKFDICDGLGGDINLAQLIISESSVDSGDAEMYVFDAGLSGELTFDNLPLGWGLRGTAYVFSGIKQGVSSAFTSGNSSTMENPRVLVGTADLEFNVLDNIPVNIFGQIGLNTNEHATDNQTEALMDVRDQRHFWSCGIEINKLKEAGDFKFDYKFAYIERNFIPSGLPDDDIGTGNQAHWWILTYRWLPSTDIDITLIAPRRLDGDKETETLLGKFNIKTRF